MKKLDIYWRLDKQWYYYDGLVPHIRDEAPEDVKDSFERFLQQKKEMALTKQDILNMKTKDEIMLSFITHLELWDDEVNEHLKKVAKKENLELYGSEDFLPTLPRKKKSELDDGGANGNGQEND